VKLPRASRQFAALAVLIAVAAAVPLHAAEPARYTIGARVVSVAADKSTAVINRGKAEAIIPGSPVVIRPNRGDNEADIEWDIAFAKGVVHSVGKDTSVVKLTDVWQDIQARDYCAVDADIPVALRDTDLVRIALFDITFLDHARQAPLFTLAGLLRDPSARAFDTVIEALLREIRETSAEVMAANFKTDRIKGGLFAGLTLQEAFRATTREHIEKFLVYTAWLPGRLINYDWSLIDRYANWAYDAAPSAEAEKRASLAGPAIQGGNGLVAKGEFKEALAEYNKALLIDPDNAGAKNKIQTVNRVLERMRMLQEDEKDVPARRALGVDLFNLALYDRALAELLKARDLGDGSVEVRRYLGYTHAALSHYAEARALLEPLAAELSADVGIGRWLDFVRQNEILAKQGPNVGAYMAVGEIKYKSGSYDDAIAEFNEALELAPRDPAIWKRIGQTALRRRARQEDIWAKDFWQKGEFEEARSRWKTALEDCRLIDDKDSLKTILRGAGAIMYGSGFTDDAIEAYGAILEVDPEDADSPFEIARCYKDKKEYDKAIEWALNGLAKNPKSAWGYDVLGAIHDNAGRIDEAIANYQKSADLDPAYRDPLYNLGRLSALRGEYDKAAAFFRRALELDDEYALARTRLQEVDGVVEARARLKAAPDDTDALVRLVNALWGLSDYTRAVGVLNEALRSGRDAAWVNEELGHCLIRLGRTAEGKAALEASYRLRPKPDVGAWIRYVEAQSQADALPGDPGAELALGQDSLYWQDYEAALKHFSLANSRASIADEIAAGQERARRGQEASRQLTLSSEYYGRAQYEESVERARQALAVFRESESLRGQFNALLRIGWGLSAQFKHKEALEAYAEAKRLSETLEDDGLLATVETSLGGHYAGFGEYEKALGYQRHAQALRRRTNSALDEAWSVLPNIGWLQSRLGDADGEIACYEQALAAHRRLVYRRGEASALLSLAGAYQDRDEYPKALDAYGKALEIGRARAYNEVTISAYSGLGTIYAAVGDVENARKFFQYYLEEAQVQGLKWQRANALNKLGLLYLENVKDYGQAMGFFKDSQALARTVGDGRMEGVASANIAVVLSRQGSYREALGLHEEALRLIREFKDPSLEMQGLNELGETYLGLKDYDKAIDSQIRAREIAMFLQARSEQWRYEAAAGKAYEAKGDRAKSIEYLEKAVATLRGVKSRIASEGLLQRFSEQEEPAEVYKRLASLLLKAGRAEEARAYIDESKSKLVKDAFSGVKLTAEDAPLKETLTGVDKSGRKKEAIEQEIRAEKEKPEEARDPLKLETLTKTLAQTEGEFNQWMMKLKFQNRKMYDALSIKPATLGDVQRQVPAGAVFLEYFISPEELYVFCIGREFFLARSTVIAEAELNTLVSRFVRACQEPPSGGPDDRLLSQARRLYDILIAPVKDVVAKYETVVIVPFGPLYYLPFHALVTDESGKPEYLIERKRISYTTSATFADILKDQVRGHKSFMGFGDPDGSLPAATAELQGLQDKIFKSGAKVFTSGKATKEAFFAQAKNADILHLATHGVIEANPLESYLLFAGATKETQELTLLEVAGYTALRERNSLVFLSACQTAKEAAKAGTGSELITLAEAFAMAGAPTLIATLWEVEDNATRLFSETFYDQLANKNKDKLDAMRAGQIALIRSAEYAHPFYWASFLMIGSWR
jgi:CHAT domain-containing protein/Flp pilus assembly protein TadD